MTNALSHAYKRLFDRSGVIICLTLVAVLISGVGAVQFSSDYKAYFGKGNPELRAFEAFEARYSQGDGILIVLQPPETVFTDSNLHSIAGLTDRAWQTPHSTRIDSITNFQHIESDGDTLVVSAVLEDPESPVPLDSEVIKTKTLGEPLLVNRLISPDGKTTGIYITLVLPGEEHGGHLSESVAYVRELVGEFREEKRDWKVAVTGLALFAAAEVEVTQNDLVRLAPIMIAVIAVLLLVCLRSYVAVAQILVIVLLSTASVLGLSGWFDILLNPTSAISIVVVMTLAVADCVHIILTYQDRFNGEPPSRDRVMACMKLNFEAISLTSLTTALGFLALNFSDSPPFHDLGNLAAAGVMVAWLLSILLLPAMMSLSNVSARVVIPADRQVMSSLAEFVIRHSKTILIAVGLSSLVIISAVPHLELDDRYVEWFDSSVGFRVDTDFATSELTGPYMLEIDIDSGEPGGVAEPEFLRFVQDLENFGVNHPKILHVDGYASLQKKLNRAMNGGGEDDYTIPTTRELSAQYLLLYEMSLPYGLDITNRISLSKSAVRASFTLIPASQSEIALTVTELESWIAQHKPTRVKATVTGTILMFVHLAERNIKSMLVGTGLAFGFIAILMMIVLRDWRLGLLSLVPNVIPVAVTFGLWSLTVGYVGIIASIITATTLGLIVDDTIHLITKYARAKERDNLSTHEAVMETFAHVGKALWVTSMVLAAGFFVLSFSSFRLNQEMGVMTAITLVVALILDFLLLPAMLMMFHRDSKCRCRVCQSRCRGEQLAVEAGTR